MESKVTFVPYSIILNFLFKVTNMSGWLVTDLISPNMIQSQQDALGGRHQISINNTAVMQRLRATYYWAAPEAYLGNKVREGRNNVQLETSESTENSRLIYWP